MRQKHKTKGSLVAALDVGSTKIACFIGRVVDDAGNFEILGIGKTPSKGIKNGTIVNLDKAEICIRQCVHAAEKMAADIMKGYPLREIIVNLPAVHARSHSYAADVQISGHEVTYNDINHALAIAQKEAIEDDTRELIHTIPVGYRVDGHQGITDPEGMFGQNMQVDIHLVTGDLSALKNIATCIERSHLDITALCVAPYSAGLASLVEDEMDLGCTVIDMGGGVTSFAVFHGGVMVYADAIPIGGDHVTNDIAKGLVTSAENAERIKCLYGNAMASPSDESEMIDVPPLGEEDDSPPQHVPRSILVGIIQPRLEEIFEIIHAQIKDSGVEHLCGRRVVLTGGASQLPGIKDLSAHVLDKQVRLGRPIRFSGLLDAVAGPAFATTAGLLTYMSERSYEMPGEIMARDEIKGLWPQMKAWLKENW